MNGNTSLRKEPIKITISKDKNGIYSVVNKSETGSSKLNGLFLWFNSLVKRYLNLTDVNINLETSSTELVRCKFFKFCKKELPKEYMCQWVK